MIRCAWNASSMHAIYRIVSQTHSYTVLKVPYHVRKVYFDKRFLRKQLYGFVLKIEYCDAVKNAKVHVIMAY